LQLMEQFEPAEQVLAGYLVLNPNDAQILTALARVYEGAGDLEESEETLLQLMEMNEDNDFETIQQLVTVQVALEKYEDALGYVDSLIEQDPANIPARRLRVEALTQLGNDTEAAAELDRIQRLEPGLEESERAEAKTAGTEFAAP